MATLILAAVPAACQAPPPEASSRSITTAPSLIGGPDDDRSAASAPPPIDWAGAGDCLDQLKLLHAMATHGRLEEASKLPFAVVQVTPTTSLEWVRAQAVPLTADLPLESYEDQGTAATAAPCLLLVEQPGDVRTAHRVVDFQTVASQYQSSIRSDKNPDYDAAQARVREAERETKKSGGGILRVGDPMLDLVGLLVGGVIATFGQFGGDDDLDDALATLKETPRSRDRPVYRAYEFERSMVRAGKEATIGVALRDLKRGRVRRAQLRQREMRQFAVLDGLDPRDRHYDQHRAGALSWQEFEHWQQQPPQLPMSALVAALVESGGPGEGPQTSGSEQAADAPAPALPIDGSKAPQAAEQEGPPVRPRVAALAPSAGPELRPPSIEARAPREPGAGADHTVFSTALDPRAASLVRLQAGSLRGSGFYVKPRLVVTTDDVVGAASVIDVTTSDGEVVLGLVVHTDPVRNLAVVHVPRAGLPSALFDGPALAPGTAVDVLELVGEQQARLRRATLRPSSEIGDRTGTPVLHLAHGVADAATSTGAPVFLDDRAVALVADRQDGPERHVIRLGALDELLDSGALAALH